MCAQPKMGNGRRVSLGFGGASAAIGDHIAHFYRGSNQRFDVLGPYFKEGIQNGDKCVLISAPEVASELCDWLTSNDIDAADARASRQLILHPGAATMEEMQTLTERIEADSFKEGHKFVRWAGDMGWGLEGNFSVSEMLRWEALYDQCSSGWQIFALCQYDLTRFGGEVVMDALRSHALCVMGQVLVPNPYHVSPEILLQEFAERN